MKQQQQQQQQQHHGEVDPLVVDENQQISKTMTTHETEETRPEPTEEEDYDDDLDSNPDSENSSSCHDYDKEKPVSNNNNNKNNNHRFPKTTTTTTTTNTSRKTRKSGSTHFGDIDFDEEEPHDIGDATWREVLCECCVHSPYEWFCILIAMSILLFFLYFFMFALELLSSSAKVLSGCTAGSLLGDETNPVAAVMMGILATVLLQSSSTTTSIVVSLVGAEAIPTRQAIYMIMGANIGTSVTNSIVAMGHTNDGDELERAFAGATVHDMFNFLSVAVFLPVEVMTGFLYYVTKALLPEENFEEGENWDGPVRKLVSPLGRKIIIPNKDVMKKVATREDNITSCSYFYPVECRDDTVDYTNCQEYGRVGLIGCDKKTNDCPIFFQNGSSEKDDKVSGGVCIVLSLILLIACLVGLVTVLQKMLLGTSTRIIYKATNINEYLSLLIGCGITILVQSSSITTSTLTPLVGMGVLHLEQMLPLTLGANVGTTFTAIMAALVSDKLESLQVALAHLFFNLSGIIVWYPLPILRSIPLNASRLLGKSTRMWRGFPAVYIGTMFFLIPVLLLAISSLFEMDGRGFTVLGSFLTIVLVLMLLHGMFWWKFRDGRGKFLDCMKERQRKKSALKTLPDELDSLREELAKLKEHVGYRDPGEESDSDDDVDR